MSAEPLPQLRMVLRLGQVPARPSLQDGYRLRMATLSDAESISEVLEAAFQEPWGIERVLKVLLDDPNVPTTWLVEAESQVVATASYQVMPIEFPTSGWVHYVGAKASHAGKGLGSVVTWAVIDQAAHKGKSEVRLTTDDHRLAAIKTYLKLGFEPEMWHESHPRRWETIRKAL